MLITLQSVQFLSPHAPPHPKHMPNEKVSKCPLRETYLNTSVSFLHIFFFSLAGRILSYLRNYGTFQIFLLKRPRNNDQFYSSEILIESRLQS